MLTSNKEVEEIVSFALPERNVRLGILEPFTYHAVFDAPKKFFGVEATFFLQALLFITNLRLAQIEIFDCL